MPLPSPEDRAPARAPQGFAAALAATALVCAGLGAAEALLRLVLDLEPSLARSAPGLILYGAISYGLAGALAAVLSALVRRRAPSIPGPIAALAGAALVLGLLGPRLDEARLAARAALLAGALGLALVLDLAASRATRSRAPRPRTAAAIGTGLVLVALVLGTALRARQTDRPPLAPPPPAGEAPPDVLFVVVDTLRADVLSVYGGPVATPHLARLAARGVRFDGAVAPSSWTLPSVASLLDGRYPRDHGVVDFGRPWEGNRRSLPEELRRAGYHARAVVGNPFLAPELGFDRVFDRYDLHGFELEASLFVSGLTGELLRLAGPLHTVPRGADPILVPTGRFPFLTTRLAPNVHDRDLNARLLDAPWPGDRPRFAYVQYVSPHRPYLPRPYRFFKRWTPFAEPLRERLIELYRGEVAGMDEALGELLAAFDLERTLVVFTSDHGEAFLEHGRWEHGYDLYQEVVHVPLIVAGPGVAAGRVVTTPVSLVDVAPTVLGLLGRAAPADWAGRDLTPLIREEASEPAPRILFSETVSRFLTPGEEWFAAREGPWKVVHRLDRQGELQGREVYRLDRDPGEEHPLEEVPGAEDGATLERLEAALETYRARRVEGGARDLSATERERMDALGYTEAGSE